MRPYKKFKPKTIFQQTGTLNSFKKKTGMLNKKNQIMQQP